MSARDWREVTERNKPACPPERQVFSTPCPGDEVEERPKTNAHFPFRLVYADHLNTESENQRTSCRQKLDAGGIDEVT